MCTLAISILNWNNIHDTISCLNSLKESIFQDFDIYLLDNGSENHEYLKLKKIYGKEKNIIIYESQKNLGFTGGNNLNFKNIQEKNYDYILLLNNDTLVPSNFLGNFIEKAKKIEHSGIFGPEIRNMDDSLQSIGNKINLFTGASKRYKYYNKDNTIDYVSGSCFLIKTEVIKEIGFLDDIFFAYYEESDFCLRAKKKGFETQIIPETKIYHKEETANKKEKNYYCYLMFRNRILFLKKHSRLLQYVISYIFLICYMLILFPKEFGFRNYKYAFKGIIHGIMGIGGNIKF